MARTKGALGKKHRQNSKYNTERMIQAVHKYTDEKDYPTLKECCVLNEWDYDYFLELQRENAVLRREAVRLLTKKEVFLEKAIVLGPANGLNFSVSGCIFALKQLGWKDEPNPIIVNNTIQNNQGGNRSEKLRKCDTKTLEQLEAIYNEMDAEASEGKDAQKGT